jgi:hypothetical protein
VTTHPWSHIAALSLVGSLVACSSPEVPPVAGVGRSAPAAERDESAGPRFVDKVWRITAPVGRPPGSLHVFLSDGTLLMTSCVETYRLAQWTLDTPASMTITEDSQTRYRAEITALDDQRLELKLHLRSETVDLVMTVANTPYVCPDMKR